MLAPVPPTDPARAVLAAAAFGAHPGLAAAELPAAPDAVAAWHRAVVLGGQGHYAAARAELRGVRTRTADPALLSLVASTEGSLLRQLGWHARAAVLDGRAAALALPVADAGTARCDALTGLAADALGTARLPLATRLLGRVEAALPADQMRHWRPWVRWHWVSAETSLAAGASAPALSHARAAVALAEDAPSVRHRIKSTLLLAAANAAAGRADDALALAATVAGSCREHGLLPLRWAAAMLRSGLVAGADAADAAADAAHCAAVIARRGGRFR